MRLFQKDANARSQFKRSEEEVRAQIEVKQALMSEIIEEKVKTKV